MSPTTKLFFKYFNIIFLLFLFPVGIFIYKDYGISIDESISRTNGLVNLKYVFSFFSINIDSYEFLKNVPDLQIYFDRDYGAFFETINVLIIEYFLNINNISEVFYARHLLNYFLFVISIFVFYLIILEIFKNNFFAFFSALTLFSTPRIFANSFYNSKDLAFMSFFIILIYFSLKFIKKQNISNTIVLAFVGAVAINTRVVAIYVPLLVYFFIFLESIIENKILKKKLIYIFLNILFTLIFIYMIWPYLWDAPLIKFIEIINVFQSFGRGPEEIFYLGNYYKTNFLPWHYFFVSFFATNPLAISLLIVVGAAITISRFYKRMINIDDKVMHDDIWRGKKEKFVLFNFFLVFLPIFLIIIFNSTLYTGWRHLYFIYPSLIIISLSFLDFFKIKYRNKRINKALIFLCFFIVANNFYSIVKYHPFQYVYFNTVFASKANKLFELDYWGVANKHALQKLDKSDQKNRKILIGSASLVDLQLTKKILEERIRDRITLTGQNFKDVDYIFTNNYYGINHNYEKKYKIPKNYSIFLETKKGNITINQIYKKN
jgi:hypothetical protein